MPIPSRPSLRPPLALLGAVMLLLSFALSLEQMADGRHRATAYVFPQWPGSPLPAEMIVDRPEEVAQKLFAPYRTQSGGLQLPSPVPDPGSPPPI